MFWPTDAVRGTQLKSPRQDAKNTTINSFGLQEQKNIGDVATIQGLERRFFTNKYGKVSKWQFAGRQSKHQG